MEHDNTESAGRGLPITDRLAMARTGLANERTLLAYVRTALAFVIIGGACIKFFDGVGMTVLGVVVIGVGAGVGGFGGVRYRRVKREIGG